MLQVVEVVKVMVDVEGEGAVLVAQVMVVTMLMMLAVVEKVVACLWKIRETKTLTHLRTHLTNQ